MSEWHDAVLPFSVKLDDPSFPAPIYASLVESEGEDLALIWSRCRIAD